MPAKPWAASPPREAEQDSFWPGNGDASARCTPQPNCKPTCPGVQGTGLRPQAHGVHGARPTWSNFSVILCTTFLPSLLWYNSAVTIPARERRTCGSSQPSSSQGMTPRPRERTAEPLNTALAAGVRRHRALRVCRHGASVRHPQGARPDTTGPSLGAGPAPTASASGSRGRGGPGYLLVPTADGQGHAVLRTPSRYGPLWRTRTPWSPIATASTPHTWVVPSHFRGPRNHGDPARPWTCHSGHFVHSPRGPRHLHLSPSTVSLTATPVAAGVGTSPL